MPNLLSKFKVPFGAGPAKRPVDNGFPTDRLKFATKPVQNRTEAGKIKPISDQTPFVDQEFKERPKRNLLEIAYFAAACLSVAVIGLYMIVRPAGHEHNLAGKQPDQNKIESNDPQIDNLFDFSDTGITKASNAVDTPAVATDGDQAALTDGAGLAWSQYALKPTVTEKADADPPDN